MAKIVSCRDVGVDCDFVAKGETEQDILQQCTEHARSAHNMTEIPAELVDKVRGAIRDEATWAEIYLSCLRGVRKLRQDRSSARA